MADTIYALATAPGRAGVAVVRVSGPAASAAGAALAGRPPGVGRPRLCWLRCPESSERLDQALVLGFASPASFTGEDIVEFQMHGGPAVVRSVLAALAGVDGLRLAEPGEFTRRALMNGRIDLAQVEGLGDLLAAETRAQQRLAMRAVEGGLSRRVADWGATLVEALAFVEASIDFADEALPDDLLASVVARLDAIEGEMAAELAGSRAAERVRDGFEVAVVGAPNVGKSTLLNTVAGRDVALTSDVAGTTRDVIEVRLDVAGLPVTMLDMAGLREAGDRVERMGVERARERARAADLRLFLVMTPADVAELGVAPEPDDLVVLAKADARGPCPGLAVSGLTGAGVDAVLEAIAARLGERAAAAGTLAHERQRRLVADAVEGVRRARANLTQGTVELAAEELRLARRSLDFLLGKSDVEAVLDVIFASFCLGK